ncbi:MCE family protein [Monashia sp. NPDC004114]
MSDTSETSDRRDTGDTGDAAAGPLTQLTRFRIGVRLYGLVFLVVVGLLVALAVAVYQKAFTPVALVTLETTRAGSQLQDGADVKLRGLVVGEVRRVEATPDGARLTLAIQPDQLGQIPADVRARLLPKTLFGERYVDLETVAQPSRARLADGDVIGQDRSAVAIELETVLDNLYPLLRTVQPGQLATTLNALSTTLEGRGDELGRNLVLVDRYLRAFNPSMPVLKQDISLLADTLDVYADVAPDAFRLMESLRVTNRTVVEKDQQLAAFLVGTAGFANTTAGFLRDNEARIIQVGEVGRPTLQLLAEYSPVYPCLARGLVAWLPRINAAFSGGVFHITLEVVPPRAAYRPGEEPRWGEKRGPNCFGLPNPPGSQSNPFPGHHFDDGTQPAGDGSLQSALPAALLGNAAADSGTAGTVEEQQVVSALLARDGTDASRTGDGSGADGGSAAAQPSGIQTLLAGPILRGTVVSTR